MDVSEEKRITDNEIQESIKSKVSSFPNMPQAAVKLRALLKEDDVQMDEIANILRQDPGLSTNVLRLANSAHFGLSQKVGFSGASELIERSLRGCPVVCRFLAIESS